MVCSLLDLDFFFVFYPLIDKMCMSRDFDVQGLMPATKDRPTFFGLQCCSVAVLQCYSGKKWISSALIFRNVSRETACQQHKFLVDIGHQEAICCIQLQLLHHFEARNSCSPDIFETHVSFSQLTATACRFRHACIYVATTAQHIHRRD